jgi:uncharacterized protein
MENNYSNSISVKILAFLGIIFRFLGFYILGPAIALFAFSLILGIEITEINELYLSADNSPGTKAILLAIQGIGQLLGFIILPLLYIHYFNKSLYSKLSITLSSPKFGVFFSLAILIMLSAIPFISWIIDWNKSIDLPSFMDSLERSMQATEAKLEYVTKKLVYYSNYQEFLVAIVVFAIIPAIGEELLFRGIMQNEFSSLFKNPHLAIWFTGLLFSFMHFQFYGFFPRMLLGVTFGYLYFWSGNIIIPILVHFLNNALTLITMNLYKQKIITMDPDSVESFPSISIIISLIVFSFLLFTFRRLNIKRTTNLDHP